VARARDIPGLHAATDFSAAAAAAVAVRADELFDHAENVLDMQDIERVHDMRVSTRRLRAVLEIYEPCFPKRLFRPVLADVKALADALGARRDADVQLAALMAFEAAVGEADAPGVEAFAARVRSEQLEGNAVLAAALRHAEEHDLRGRLAALVAAAAPPAPADGATGAAPVDGAAPLDSAAPPTAPDRAEPGHAVGGLDGGQAA
jgi:CHAD domain-containing protein